jgi:hypothetical protein
MTALEIMVKLQLLGSLQTKKTLMKHGAKEPVFGVKIEELKKIRKTVKGNNPLAMELFRTGNYDAMYLAGLIADGAEMTKEEITGWADAAYGTAIGEYTVPWVATENKSGFELAESWIESENENIAATGWSTFSNIVSVWPDKELDHQDLKSLLNRVEREIHKAPNRVRYTMNGFIIATGCYVPALKDECLNISGRIGPVKVEMHGTACKVPSAADYINKVSKMGRTGQKRKTAKC